MNCQILIDGPRPIRIVNVLPPFLPEVGDCRERVMILTGKRKKPDHLSWSGTVRVGMEGEWEVACQGLYRGSYADGKVLASNLYGALILCAPREARAFKQAWDAWNGEGG